MYRTLKYLARTAAGAIAIVGIAAACSDTSQPITSVDAGMNSAFMNEGVGQSVTVCKVTGVEGQSYEFTASGVGGYIPPMPRGLVPSLTAIQDVSCKGFWLAEDPTAAPTALTVTELGDVVPDSIVVNPFSLNRQVYTGTNSVVVNVDYYTGALIKVYNPTEVPPPPGGMYGCTPGYWKQSQHFGNWTGYTTGQYYNTVFGVSMLSSSTTLLQALGLGGGGYKRLARHSTAALLNAAALGDDYAFTTAEIIAAVQNAVATGNYDLASDAFEMENERGCPLGREE